MFFHTLTTVATHHQDWWMMGLRRGKVISSNLIDHSLVGVVDIALRFIWQLVVRFLFNWTPSKCNIFLLVGYGKLKIRLIGLSFNLLEIMGACRGYRNMNTADSYFSKSLWKRPRLNPYCVRSFNNKIFLYPFLCRSVLVSLSTVLFCLNSLKMAN